MPAGFITFPDDYFYEAKPYKLRKPDIRNFKKLWKNYKRLGVSSNKAFSVAVNRYFYATQRNNEEDKIIDLMIAFEALFLNVNSELSFRLALVVSKFLEDYFDRESSFAFIKKAYNLRSKIVHGADVKPKDLRVFGKELSMKQFVKELQEVLRMSLFYYVQNYSSYKVPALIEMIDKSIVKGQ